jgi:hypothetical protein
MIKVEIPQKKRSYMMPATLVLSLLFHIGLWAVLTEWGKRPVSDNYLVQLVMKQKEPFPTPEPEKPKPDLKKLVQQSTPPPKEDNIQQLLEKKTIEQQIKAEFQVKNRDRTETNITNLSAELFQRRGPGDNPQNIPSLVNVHGRGSGDPGPPATTIRIGSGRKGGIGISTSGEGSVSINIGSGLGGGRGAGRGSGTGDGPDVPTMRLGGVGFGNGRGGGGGGGDGGGPNIGNIGSGVKRAKVESAPTVAISNVAKKDTGPAKTDVSGEWVVVAVAGPIAGLQIKCLNNPGIHIYDDVRIQCENNTIVAAWRRK